MARTEASTRRPAGGWRVPDANVPAVRSGWVVIFGIFTDSNVDYAVNFTWGKFCCAPLADFAVSNAQLTSNKYVPLVKVQIERHKGRPMIRDYLQVEQVKEAETNKARIVSMKTLSPEVHNPEFNEADKGLLDDMDGRSCIQVGGLRNRIVVIFRAEDRQFLAGQAQQDTEHRELHAEHKPGQARLVPAVDLDGAPFERGAKDREGREHEA